MLLFCVYVCPVCAPCKDWCVLVSVFLNIALPCFWIALEVADVNSGGGGGGGWLAYDTVATCWCKFINRIRWINYWVFLQLFPLTHRSESIDQLMHIILYVPIVRVCVFTCAKHFFVVVYRFLLHFITTRAWFNFQSTNTNFAYIRIFRMWKKKCKRSQNRIKHTIQPQNRTKSEGKKRNAVISVYSQTSR